MCANQTSFWWLKSHFCLHLVNFVFLTPDFWTVCLLVDFQHTTVNGISICVCYVCFRKTTLTTCPCIQLIPVSTTRCVYTVTSKPQKTMKEARSPVILSNSFNSNSKRVRVDFAERHWAWSLTPTIGSHPLGT